MIHIKRDGCFLCKQDMTKSKWYNNMMKKESSISFIEAHKTDFKYNEHFCKNCIEIYFIKISRLKKPIIV